ncbi:DnaD domain-containing protein [Paenibacillus sp. FSL R10-2771]|uniref:DnaD domain-containing protein n=1 Tax=Paenibacillus sp. FSL R10-2771 TaxID=2954693 RepID=UPI0030FC1D9A
MAEKRMISKVISISEKVNELPSIFDMLLFTWMIPHTDDFGRMAGSPGKVRHLVVPMLDCTKEDVSTSLQRLQAQGLILWYEADGERVVQIQQFEKHQQGLHKRTRSKFPDFPGSSGNHPVIPSELNRTELNLTEENLTEGNGTEQKGTEPGSEASPGTDEDDYLYGGGPLPPISDAFRMFENEGFGTISDVIKDQLEDFIKDYTERWLCEAMKKAVLAGKRNLGYVQGILKRWKAEGIDEPWTKDKPPEQTNNRNHRGYSGKPHIEIVKPSTDGPTPEDIALQKKLMADLQAKKEAEERRRQEERDRGEGYDR